MEPEHQQQLIPQPNSRYMNPKQPLMLQTGEAKLDNSSKFSKSTYTSNAGPFPEIVLPEDQHTGAVYVSEEKFQHHTNDVLTRAIATMRESGKWGEYAKEGPWSVAFPLNGLGGETGSCTSASSTLNTLLIGTDPEVTSVERQV
jgi:hypothetical protein